jgi:hypothetical protein
MDGLEVSDGHADRILDGGKAAGGNLRFEPLLLFWGQGNCHGTKFSMVSHWPEINVRGCSSAQEMGDKDK